MDLQKCPVPHIVINCRMFWVYNSHYCKVQTEVCDSTTLRRPSRHLLRQRQDESSLSPFALDLRPV